MNAKKIKNIIKAWTSDEGENTEYAKNRLEACLKCPLNTINGAKLTNPIHKAIAKTSPKFGQCSLCGCPIDKKIKVLSESCPDEPKVWKSLEVDFSKNNRFKVGVVKGADGLELKDGVFRIDATNTDSNFFIELNIYTKDKCRLTDFISDRGEDCKSMIEKKGDKEYNVKVYVKKECNAGSIGFTARFLNELSSIARKINVMFELKLNEK